MAEKHVTQKDVVEKRQSDPAFRSSSKMGRMRPINQATMTLNCNVSTLYVTHFA